MSYSRQSLQCFRSNHFKTLFQRQRGWRTRRIMRERRLLEETDHLRQCCCRRCNERDLTQFQLRSYVRLRGFLRPHLYGLGYLRHPPPELPSARRGPSSRLGEARQLEGGGSCCISAGSLSLADGTTFLRTACRVKSVFGLKRLIGEMYIEEIIFQQTEATVLDQRKIGRKRAS